jgi:hypothetical protein
MWKKKKNYVSYFWYASVCFVQSFHPTLLVLLLANPFRLHTALFASTWCSSYFCLWRISVPYPSATQHGLVYTFHVNLLPLPTESSSTNVVRFLLSPSVLYMFVSPHCSWYRRFVSPPTSATSYDSVSDMMVQDLVPGTSCVSVFSLTSQIADTLQERNEFVRVVTGHIFHSLQ